MNSLNKFCCPNVAPVSYHSYLLDPLELSEIQQEHKIQTSHHNITNNNKWKQVQKQKLIGRVSICVGNQQ